MPAKPTAKQAKALELIRQGEKPTVAMRKAGYTPQTSEAPKQNLLSRPGVQAILDQYRAEYDRVGIKPSYYVERVKDLIEAEKVHSSHTEPDRWVPDWQARAKGLEIYRKDIGVDLSDHQPTTNVLVIPGELIAKYGVTSDTERSSTR